MQRNARIRLPAGIVEASPPDEESRYGRELGTKAKVTWAWLKSKFGKQPPRDEVSDRDYFNGVWGQLTILVRPFDSDGQWIDNLRQEFTSDGLRDAQQYGFDLIRDLAQVKGFWLSGVLDKYWSLKGRGESIRVIDLGIYERSSGLMPNSERRYYVWVLLSNGTPKDEGPYGPYEFIQAKNYARISATEGEHDRAVSIGADPQAHSFQVVRRYERGTGRRTQ